MNSLQALIFDVDGTLADTERDGHRPAFNKAFAEAGLPWEWSVELYAKLLAVTGGKERIRYFMDQFLEGFEAPADLNGFIAGLHQSKTRFYLQMLQEGLIPLRPGVARLLGEAREAGLRLAIATTTTPENVTQLLEATLGKASIGWFEVIAAGDIVPAKKPAPDIFVHALEQMNLSPTECLAFEDSENGLRSSLGADLPTLVTTNGYTRDQDLEGALLVIDSLGEPDAPFEVLSGDAGASTYVDVALLRDLRARA